MAQRSVDELIDGGRLRPLHFRVMALCMLIALVDGVDAQSIAIVLPAMAADLGFSKVGMGLILTIMQVGSIAGGIIFGTLADRWGRKPAVLLSLLLVTLFTWASSLDQPHWMMMLVRFLAGMGLAGTLPPTLSLASEFGPKRLRGTIISAVGTGYALGTALGAFLAGYVLAAFGWRLVFGAGAMLSFVTMLLVLGFLPESPRYMARRAGQGVKLHAVLSRIAPGEMLDTAYLDQPVNDVAAGPAKFPLRHLIGPEFLRITMLMALCCVASGIAIRVLSGWLPTLLLEEGIPLGESANVLGVLGLACVVGTPIIGKLADRFGFKVAIVPAMLLAALVSLGLAFTRDMTQTFVVAGLVGFLMSGASAGPMIAAAALYPIHLRSTTLGFVTAASRVGMTIGPMLVPLLLAVGTLNMVYMMISSAFMVTGLAIWAARKPVVA